MGQLGRKADAAGSIHGHGVLAQPDAIVQQGVTTTLHDAFESGVVALGEGVVGVLHGGLELPLDVAQCLGEFADVVGTGILHGFLLAKRKGTARMSVQCPF